MHNIRNIRDAEIRQRKPAATSIKPAESDVPAVVADKQEGEFEEVGASALDEPTTSLDDIETYGNSPSDQMVTAAAEAPSKISQDAEVADSIEHVSSCRSVFLVYTLIAFICVATFLNGIPGECNFFFDV